MNARKRCRNSSRRHTHKKKTKSFDIWKTCLRPIAFSFSFSLNLMAGFFSSRFTPSPFLFRSAGSPDRSAFRLFWRKGLPRSQAKTAAQLTRGQWRKAKKSERERNKIFDRIIFLIDDTAHVCDRELLKGAGNGGREERAARLLAEPTYGQRPEPHTRKREREREREEAKTWETDGQCQLGWSTCFWLSATCVRARQQ